MELVVNIIGVAAVFWGLYYANKQLLFTNKQLEHSAQINQETLDWNRRTYTENYLAIKPDKNLVKKLAEQFNTTDSVKTIPLSNILNAIKKDKEVRKNIAIYLNRYERISRYIKFDLMDEKLVIQALGSHMVKDYLNYSEYIKYNIENAPTGGFEDYNELILNWNKIQQFKNLFDQNKEQSKSD